MSKNLKKMIKGEPSGLESLTVAAQIGYGVKAPQPSIELTKEERRQAKAWLLEQLAKAPTSKTEALICQCLTCLIEGMPFYEMPMFKQFMLDLRRKRAESIEKRRKIESWRKFKEKGYFKAEDWHVSLETSENATIKILEPFKVEVEWNNQKRLIDLGSVDLEHWKNLILEKAAQLEAEAGAKPRKVTVPLRSVNFVAPLIFRGTDDLKHATIKEDLTKTVEIVLMANRR